VDVDSICDKAAEFRDTIKETRCVVYGQCIPQGQAFFSNIKQRRNFSRNISGIADNVVPAQIFKKTPDRKFHSHKQQCLDYRESGAHSLTLQSILISLFNPLPHLSNCIPRLLFSCVTCCIFMTEMTAPVPLIKATRYSAFDRINYQYTTNIFILRNQH